MKSLFRIGSYNLVLHDFKESDLNVLLRLQVVDNPYKPDKDSIQFEGRLQDMSVLPDDDIFITGLNDSANAEQIADKIDKLKSEAERNFKWYLAEQEKVKELTKKLSEVQS